MVRKDWTNLNGLWDFGFVPLNSQQPPTSLRKILVPFPVESQLSGIDEMVPEGHAIWYRRTFARPKEGAKTLLHFGGSDWKTSVWINGKLAGEHEGGFDPFTFDISSLLTKAETQEVVVTVSDPTDGSTQPRGKQVRKPGGIFYRPTSGIWQTVWLESVPTRHIGGLKITPHLDGRVEIKVFANGSGASEIWAEVLDGSKRVARGFIARAGEDIDTLELRIPVPKLWTPDTPFLYRIKVGLKAGADQDEVESYVGIREISLVKSVRGQPMVALNGKPIFLFGPLDQGFWPDGLYTAPSDEAMRYDIVVTKGLGFNMIRKHVKVEPQRWYYWCDKLGILVMQDMPSGDKYINPSDPDITRTPESKMIYGRELQAMMTSLYNHPSIISWVPFNEGWGQFETAEVTRSVAEFDPTRLVNATSGWTDRGVGHFHDVHVYPGPGAPKPEKGRASFLGEFGGLGLIMDGHTWQKDGWGYQSYKTKEDLTVAVENLFQQLRFIKDSTGLSGAVYTQTTDVETELNGLLTYDRALMKMDTDRLKKAIHAVYKPSPTITEVVPASEKAGLEWAYSFEKPADGWEKADFDDASWKRGEGGFGTEGTPGAVVRTKWNTSDIWIRRDFTLDKEMSTKDLLLNLHHDDDVEVYLDGKLILAKSGWTSAYVLIPWPANSETLKAGKHTFAVYCHQNRGGQYIDLGISRAIER